MYTANHNKWANAYITVSLHLLAKWHLSAHFGLKPHQLTPRLVLPVSSSGYVKIQAFYHPIGGQSNQKQTTVDQWAPQRGNESEFMGLECEVICFPSSWTKRAVEVDSPQPMSPWDKLADPPDSTCAQVIHSRPEEFSNNWIPLAQGAEYPGPDDELENVPMGKDLEIGVTRDPNLLLVDQSKVLVHSTVAHKDKTLELDLKQDGENHKGRKLEPNMEKNFELGMQAADLMSTMTKNTDHRAENQAPENQKDTGNSNLDHNILRHSDLSAFSRYNTASTTNQAPTGNVGSCSPLDNSSEAAKTESMHNLQSSSNGTPNQRSNGSSNNNDVGSTTNNVFAKPGLSNEKPVSKPQQQQAEHDELSLENMAAVAAHCGSSNILMSTGIEGNAGEAALNKFRQKRKERCFEKKVRYHSRKRMAEQRPRVRGQFVRQAAQQTRSKDADC
ncbi:CCT domain [Dillenia turbinata]|uniref:CCT domain n=1 Tax=Dillenia turbinata TaxID=194707 RepID=A0AAN8ZD32_9MAGN